MTRKKGRAVRLERVARAQAAVALAERASHAAAERACAECARNGRAMMEALSGDSPLHGLMVQSMARMLQANAREATTLQARAALARTVERREHLRADRTAERAAEARKAERAGHEAKRLEWLGLVGAIDPWFDPAEGKE